MFYQQCYSWKDVMWIVFQIRTVQISNPQKTEIYIMYRFILATLKKKSSFHKLMPMWNISSFLMCYVVVVIFLMWPNYVGRMITSSTSLMTQTMFTCLTCLNGLCFNKLWSQTHAPWHAMKLLLCFLPWWCIYHKFLMYIYKWCSSCICIQGPSSSVRRQFLYSKQSHPNELFDMLLGAWRNHSQLRYKC